MEKKPFLPHGVDFQLIGSVTAVEAVENTINVQANYTFRGDETWRAADHFPGNPVMPGVMQLESMAQTMIQIVEARPDMVERDVFLAGILDAEFKKRVCPGTNLTIDAVVSFIDKRKGLATCKITDQEGDTVATATIQFNSVRRRAERPTV